VLEICCRVVTAQAKSVLGFERTAENCEKWQVTDPQEDQAFSMQMCQNECAECEFSVGSSGLRTARAAGQAQHAQRSRSDIVTQMLTLCQRQRILCLSFGAKCISYAINPRDASWISGTTGLAAPASVDQSPRLVLPPIPCFSEMLCDHSVIHYNSHLLSTYRAGFCTSCLQCGVLANEQTTRTVRLWVLMRVTSDANRPKSDHIFRIYTFKLL
jgi:hypothetical protein